MREDGPEMGLLAVDRLRRAAGATMDATQRAGTEAPWREALRAGPMRLRAYADADAQSPLLIVPAPIKRPAIWDLAPGRSVVAAAMAAGFGVYLAEWIDVADGDVARLRLDDYACHGLDRATAAVAAAAGRPPVLVGMSLGGTFAALYAAVRPDRVAAVVLVEAPLAFSAGALGALASAAPWAGSSSAAVFERVPGVVIGGCGLLADPLEFVGGRWLDAVRSAGDPEARAAHLRVVRWTLDEFAMPGGLFRDVVDDLCRDDGFARGTLLLAGEPVRPEALRMPILAVVDPRSRLVPPAAVIPVLARGPGERRVLPHRETSPGYALRHVGALVGRDAHRHLWPAVFEWMRACDGRNTRPRN